MAQASNELGAKLGAVPLQALPSRQEKNDSWFCSGKKKSQKKEQGEDSEVRLQKGRSPAPAAFGLQLPVPLPCMRRAAPLQTGSSVPRRKAPPSQDKQSFPGFFLFLRNNNPFMYSTQANKVSSELAAFLRDPCGRVCCQPWHGERGASTAAEPLLGNLHWCLLFIDSCHTSAPKGNSGPDSARYRPTRGHFSAAGLEFCVTSQPILPWAAAQSQPQLQPHSKTHTSLSLLCKHTKTPLLYLLYS